MTDVIRAAALKGYRDVMQELVGSPARLLVEFGIDPNLLDDDDALLPMDAVCGLLEASSAHAQCPDLGLRIARHQDLDVLGILGLVVQNANSPAEATEIVTRFIFLQGTALRMQVLAPGTLMPEALSITLAIDGIAHSRQRQAIELMLGMTFQIGRRHDPLRDKVKAVSLPHSLGADAARHHAFFGVPVLENQPIAALHLDGRAWQDPVPGANLRFRHMIEDHLERRMPAPTQRLSDRVRGALRTLIGTPQASRDDIARVLAIHPRTLHRQLRAENTSFQIIKDTMRQELALKYLAETEVTLDQLTALLGFPEQSAFSRACRKWFGAPPGAVRRHHRTRP
ncbi:hypothetical protein BV911_13025 [Pseudoruegeria sp. SK021]|nr:hypothetical protein BV911_13025 [Pseudoruegeria sp. SK021]